MSNKNHGALERWWAQKWALIKAETLTLFRHDCRVLIQSTWVEDRRAPQYSSEYLVLDDEVYREVVHFIGVVRGFDAHNNFQIVRSYYGDYRVER